MRQQLIEALMYPRLLLQQVIEDHNYHHKNMFEATGERCNHCTGDGCGWEAHRRHDNGNPECFIA